MPELDVDDPRARARAAREALVGKTVAARYSLKGLVGHGGMGAVYEAEHLGLGKRVAIKFVDPEFATDEQVVARFAREARAMSTIESAHIVTVFDAGTEEGRPYLVMELLRGEDLGQRLRRTRRVPLGEALHVVAQVLKGLARAHRAGIVHRDLKPDNVFLTRTDTDPLFAKIVDFGISKIDRPRASTTPMALTGRGTIIGTPLYMSPEQAQSAAEVDGRADLYSVGAILFECLSGRPPHIGESYEQVILSIVMRDAPDIRTIEPSVPEPVATFLARALARERDQRFTSAERMLAALHEIAPEEKARVPLDPAPAQTLVSEGAQTDVHAAVHVPEPSSEERPAAATKLGVAKLDARGALARTNVPEDGSDAHERAAANGAAAAAAAPIEKRASRPSANAVVLEAPKRASRPSAPASGSGSASELSDAPAGVPRAKKTGAVLFTAIVATLTGVAATFGIILATSRKADPRAETSPASAAISAPAPPSSVSSSSSSSSPSDAASLPVLAPLAPPSAAASVPGSTASPAAPSNAHATSAPKPSTLPSLPPSSHAGSKPTGAGTKPLDINRDMP